MPNTTTLKVPILVRGRTAAEFNVDEKIYLKNETLLEVDTRKVKYGDGVHRFSELEYANVTPEELENLAARSSHTHSNKEILDATTASFTTELKEKVDANVVHEWAKAETKPAYTAAEVGADATGEAAKALTDAKAYTDQKVKVNTDAITRLNGDANVEGSVKNIAAAEAAKVVDGAEESFNTLKKVAQWIATDNTQSATLMTDVSKLKTEVEGTAVEGGSTTGGLINDVNALKTLTGAEGEIQRKIKAVDDKVGQIKQEDTTYTFESTKSSANGTVSLKLVAGGSGSGEQPVSIKGTGAATVTTDETGVITVDVPATAEAATKLANGRKISLTGAITAEGVIFDGTQDIVLNVTAVDASKLFLPEGETLIIDGNV